MWAPYRAHSGVPWSYESHDGLMHVVLNMALECNGAMALQSRL